MRSRSPKRAAQERQYRRLRDQFMADHPQCQYPEPCQSRADDLHHKRGRVGADLTNVDHFAALCRPHHDFVTTHPAEAYRLGISERRIGEAS